MSTNKQAMLETFDVVAKKAKELGLTSADVSSSALAFVLSSGQLQPLFEAMEKMAAAKASLFQAVEKALGEACDCENCTARRQTEAH